MCNVSCVCSLTAMPYGGILRVALSVAVGGCALHACWQSLKAVNDIVMLSIKCAALCGTIRKTGGYGFPLGICLTSAHSTLSVDNMVTPVARHMLSVWSWGDGHYLASWLDQRHDLAAPLRVGLLCNLVEICNDSYGQFASH